MLAKVRRTPTPAYQHRQRRCPHWIRTSTSIQLVRNSMPLYSIDYDLVKPGQNYTELIDKLKTYPNWAHVLKSSWMISSPMAAAQVATELLPFMDASGKLL